METKRLPLVSILANRDHNIVQDGLLVNCYHEATPIGDMVVKRPGLVVEESLGTGCAQGSITYNGNAVWVQDDQLWTGSAGLPTPSTFSALTTPTKPVNGSSIGTARPGYLVSDGTNLYSIGGRNNGDASTNVYRSIDNGTSWSLIASAVWTDTLQFSNVACFFSGKIRVLHKNTGNGKFEAWSSPTGVTWTLDSADVGPGVTSMNAFGYITDGTTLWAFFSLASGGTGQVWSSLNGTTFSSASTSPGWAGRDGAVALELNSILFVIAGIDGASTLLNDVWISTTGGATWVLLVSSAAFSDRQYPVAWTAAGQLWIGGGATDSGGSTRLNDIWTSSDGASWLQAAASAAWSVRYRSSFALHNSSLYVGPGTTNSSIIDGLFAATIAISTSIPLTPPPAQSCLPFQLTLIPATATEPVKVFLKNRDVAYVWNGLSLVQVTDPDYPPQTVYGVVYLDGTIYVMDVKGKISGSDLANPLSWSALNFISANAEADAAVALVRQLNYVVAFKAFSTEFFYNAGNATGSPLSKVLNALLEIGLATSGSLAFADNTVYFMANARQKGRSIMKMEGYTPKYISTPYVDRILNADDLVEVYSFVVKSNGHFFYVLTLVTSAITLVLDEMTGEWHTWTSLTQESPLSGGTLVVQSDGSILYTAVFPHGLHDGDPIIISGATPLAANGSYHLRFDPSTMSASQFSYYPTTSVTGPVTGVFSVVYWTESFFPAVYYSYGNGKDLLLDRTTGDVYSFDPAEFQDDGNPINLLIQTALLDLGVMATKRYNRCELVGDLVDTTILVRYSDDDYNTYSLYRPIRMALRRAQVRALGSGRRRAYVFRHTDATELRLLAAEYDFDVGAF